MGSRNSWPSTTGFNPRSDFSDGAFHRPDLAPVPDLHGDQPRLGDVDGGELIERHGVAIGHHGDGVEQAGIGAAGAQSAEFLLQHAEGPTHPPLDLL